MERDVLNSLTLDEISRLAKQHRARLFKYWMDNHADELIENWFKTRRFKMFNNTKYMKRKCGDYLEKEFIKWMKAELEGL